VSHGTAWVDGRVGELGWMLWWVWVGLCAWKDMRAPVHLMIQKDTDRAVQVVMRPISIVQSRALAPRIVWVVRVGEIMPLPEKRNSCRRGHGW
jgi:hypothetical protein